MAAGSSGSSPSSDEAVRGRPVVKFLYSYGGKILPSPDGRLHYVGGHTRVLAVDCSIPFSDLAAKMADLCGWELPVRLRCQLPTDDLDTLVSIKSDEDLANILEEYDLASRGRDSPLKVRVLLAPQQHHPALAKAPATPPSPEVARGESSSLPWASDCYGCANHVHGHQSQQFPTLPWAANRCSFTDHLHGNLAQQFPFWAPTNRCGCATHLHGNPAQQFPSSAAAECCDHAHHLHGNLVQQFPSSAAADRCGCAHCLPGNLAQQIPSSAVTDRCGCAHCLHCHLAQQFSASAAVDRCGCAHCLHDHLAQPFPSSAAAFSRLPAPVCFGQHHQYGQDHRHRTCIIHGRGAGGAATCYRSGLEEISPYVVIDDFFHTRRSQAEEVEHDSWSFSNSTSKGTSFYC